MKLVELIIAIAVFLSVVSIVTFLLFRYEDTLVGGSTRIQAIELVEQQLLSIVDAVENNFEETEQTVSTSTIEEKNLVLVSEIKDIDNYTKEVAVTAWYKIRQRNIPFSLSQYVVDTQESEGQSSCRPSQDKKKWINLESYTKQLNNYQNIQPTSVVLREGRVFIGSDSSVASAPDVYIFKINHDTRELTFISSINTGPGVADLAVVGDYIYAANTSINGQLQIIRVNGNSLELVSQYKIPGIYNDNTTIGNSLFYKKGLIFLGTQKSQIEELHAILVLNPLNPIRIASRELGTAVNDLIVFRNMVYIASPDDSEVQIFLLSGSTFNLLDKFDAFGNTSNGKRLVYFLGKIFLGRTVGQREVYGLNIEDEKLKSLFYFTTGVSVHGLEVYGKLMFALLNKTSNAFQIFDISSSTPQNISHNLISFLTNPIALSCDKNVFAVVELGPRITFITFSP